MKRTLSWILSILMVLSCCTALFTISVSADVVNVAAGKSVVYTNARPTPAEQGYDGDITDGVTPGPDYSNNWRAFLAGTGTAVIDLEAVTSDLTGAAVWLWASNQGDGITKPGSIKFYVSDDNENWLVAGDADLSDPLLDANPSNPMWVIADFEEGTSGRYVKMEVETTGAFTFIAEVQVITGGAAVEATYTWLGIKTFAGYAGEDVNIFVRVGEATTVDEVRVALGAVSKTYAWYYFFVVDENDVITDILVDGSEADKKDTVIPEGGYIIGIHDAFDVSSLGAAVGDSIVLEGVDFDALAALTEVTELENARFRIVKAPHVHEYEAGATTGHFIEMVCSCGDRYMADGNGDAAEALQVSHVNLYNWATFESSIVYGKKLKDVPNAGNAVAGGGFVGYIVTKTEDGDYQAVEYIGGNDDIAVDGDSFLWYVCPNNADYALAKNGGILGWYLLPTFDYTQNLVIDTHAGGVAKTMYAVPGEIEMADLADVFTMFDEDDDWHYVDLATGYIQGAVDVKDSNLAYYYAYRVEDGYLYGAAIINQRLTDGGNGAGVNFRTWLHQDEEFKGYSHFIDVYSLEGALACYVKQNTNKAGNTPVLMEGETGLVANITGEGVWTYAEFGVPLATIGADDDEVVEIFASVSNKLTKTNVALFFDGVAKDNGDGTYNYNGYLPFTEWDHDHDIEIAVPVDYADLPIDLRPAEALEEFTVTTGDPVITYEEDGTVKIVTEGAATVTVTLVEEDGTVNYGGLVNFLDPCFFVFDVYTEDGNFENIRVNYTRKDKPNYPYADLYLTSTIGSAVYGDNKNDCMIVWDHTAYLNGNMSKINERGDLFTKVTVTIASAGTYYIYKLGAYPDDNLEAHARPEEPVELEPCVIEGDETFDESTVITITNSNDEAVIYYTLDGTDPDDQTGTLYEEPFEITETTTVKAIAYLGASISEIAEATFTKNEPEPPVFDALPIDLRPAEDKAEFTATTGDPVITFEEDGTVKIVTEGAATVTLTLVEEDGTVKYGGLVNFLDPCYVVFDVYTEDGDIENIKINYTRKDKNAYPYADLFLTSALSNANGTIVYGEGKNDCMVIWNHTAYLAGNMNKIHEEGDLFTKVTITLNAAGTYYIYDLGVYDDDEGLEAHDRTQPGVDPLPEDLRPAEDKEDFTVTTGDPVITYEEDGTAKIVTEGAATVTITLVEEDGTVNYGNVLNFLDPIYVVFDVFTEDGDIENIKLNYTRKDKDAYPYADLFLTSALSNANGNIVYGEGKNDVMVIWNHTAYLDGNMNKIHEEGDLFTKVTITLNTAGTYYIYDLGVYGNVDGFEAHARPEAPHDEPCTIDAEFDDEIWQDIDWTKIEGGVNGTWQDIATRGTFTYDYKVTTDDDYVYVAIIADTPNVTMFRMWLHTIEESIPYSHFVDVFTDGRDPWIKKNGSLTTNQGAAVVPGSVVLAAVDVGENYTAVEFKFSKADAMIENDSDLDFRLNVTTGGTTTLHSGMRLWGTTNGLSNFPWATWPEDYTLTYVGLVPKTNEWTLNEGGSFGGGLINKLFYTDDVFKVSASGGWPNVEFHYPEADRQTYTVADHKFNYDFTITDCKANITLFFIGANGQEYAFLLNNTALGLTADQYDAETTNIKPGTYKGSFTLSELIASTNAYGNAFPEAEAETLTFSGIQIWVCDRSSNNALITVADLSVEEYEPVDPEPEPPEVEYPVYKLKTFVGYAVDDATIFVRIGEATTIKEIREALGVVSKTYGWYEFIVVDAEGKVIDVNYTHDGTGDKSETVVPEGGFIIGLHNDQLVDGGACYGLEVKVGDSVVLANITLDDLAAITVAGTELRGVYFYVVPAPHEHDFVETDRLGHFVFYECECGETLVTDLDGNDATDILVSHNNNFNWNIFESMIVTTGKFSDISNSAYREVKYVGYVVMPTQGGEYQVAAFIGEDFDYAVPEGGFLWYVHAANTNFEIASEGELVGWYFLPTFDLSESFAIDTRTSDPKIIYAVEGTLPQLADTTDIEGYYWYWEKFVAAGYEGITMGDLSGDGKVEAVDYLMAKRAVLGSYELSEKQELAGDVTFDGKVEAVDYLMIKRNVLGTFDLPEVPADYVDYVLEITAEGYGWMYVYENYEDGDEPTEWYNILILNSEAVGEEEGAYAFFFYAADAQEGDDYLFAYLFIPTEEGGLLGYDEEWYEFEAYEPEFPEEPEQPAENG